ncbi:membrane transport protein [Clostridium sp. AF18-27]|uniref:SLC13 family permease n=1 Tax=Enterocloster lavalensis TaxID=460384 RepID=UPI000E4D7329|nr:SLC13 family permease [Enterocloster lavalensis]MBS5604155.1 anion permease [Enterocloster asparagiformis]MCB6346598.1 anion permease [Enterocloster lavalensis]RHR57761.1 membrane transport protein [Clostridium sp. AF18-27]
MTIQMILALAILVIMIGLIMFDVLPFGAPPLLACMLLVVSGLSTVPEAFAGFTNSSVIMIASFMVVLAGVQKTRAMDKVKEALIALVNRGGYKSYVLLVIVVMVGASLVGGGNTGYYVLILSLISTIPYTKKMPTSKLMMPLGFATNHPLIPINVALYYGVVSSVLETAGFMEPVSMIKFSAVNFAMAVAFLVWSLVAYRLLPDHPIAAAEVDAQAKIEKTKAVPMEPWKEKVTVVAFVVSVVGMMLINNLGNMAYVIPGLSAMALLFMKVVDFKEFRENMFAPVILMMAGVIGVADALANSGFTAMIGEAIATALGTSVAPLLVIILFALLTSTCATFTGSNMGSVYIFAPIAIAACMSLGLNPTAAAAAVVVSGWQGGYMPIDGMPAMIMGMGKYKLPEFWKFTVPMYLIRIIALSVAAAVIFPM